MSKILRAMLVGAYSALLIQYLRITLTSRNKDSSIQLEYVFRPPKSYRKILSEFKKNGANATLRKIELTFTKPERFSTDLKYILKWTEAFSHYTSAFGNGQLAFIANKCEYYNCFITNDRSLFFDIRYFDAILFDVETSWDDHPVFRAPHQNFIFTASESANNYPVCDSIYESYYNLTFTYKLDSDIRWSYVTIADKIGKIVGPRINMTWVSPMKRTSENVIRRLARKKKAVAWFVSNCKTKSKREKIAVKLTEALDKYNLKIDIYGWCGHLSCARDRIEECLDLLEEDYYFYLAFENSLSEDYVTEKLLYPLRHFTVPIVFGGANYSRFLPPDSYINAGELNATEVAFLINKAMKNHNNYRNYFRWHNHYEYKESPAVADVCTLCKIINQPKIQRSPVKNFRKWWYPEYEKDCKELY